MTPEQMREAAAKIARHRGYFGIAKMIDDIPLTAPEPTMKDRIVDVLHDQHLRAIAPFHRPELNERRASNGWASVDARKVLEAMREPTEAMLEAGAQRTYGGLGRAPRTTEAQWQQARNEAIDIYHAMIDAALAEK